jgi:hypothetical protein
MTRSLLSTSFVLVALGSMVAACGDGGGNTGGDGGTAGSAGSTMSSGGGGAGGNGGTGGTPTTGGGGAGGTPTTGGGGEGGMAMGGGGAGGMGMGGNGGAMMTTTTTPVDPNEDQDQDGWGPLDGDCCDSPFAGCSDKPELVNPGALEYPGNGVDDDCKPATLDTDPYPICSPKAQAETDIMNQASISSLKLVRAMDLCVTTLEDPPTPKDRTWGVISSKITLADGSENIPPNKLQLGVLPDFGPNVMPQYGETMAAISSGTARRLGQPGYVQPQNGPQAGQIGNFNAQTVCNAPAEYVAANGGELPSPCSTCVGPNCTKAFDSVALRVRVRPPTNAKSFSYRFNFFSAEYPEFLCEDFNDFFVALIDGNSNDQIPADKNIAFDSNGNAVSVNNAFFQVCFPAVGAPPGSCSGGTLELIGNGMGGWSGSITDGGGTGWLQNDVPMLLKQNPNNPNDPTDLIPVVETFDLQFIIFDSGDHNVDSIVLLDRFRWNLDPAALSTHQ